MAGALLESLIEREGVDPMSAPDWLAAARQSAAASVQQSGLPGARSEAWKYTSLRALAQRHYANGDAQASTRPLDEARLSGLDGPRLVFVNGLLRRDLCDLPDVDGLSISTFARANAAELDRARGSLERDYAGPDLAFAQISAAFAADGPILRVAPGARIERPLHLVFIGANADRALAWNLRAVIELGAGASLRLVEHHLGSGHDGEALLGNVLAQYAIGENARLDLVQIQDAAANTTLIRRSDLSLAPSAVLSTHTLEIGAEMTRHDVAVDLAGDAARFVSRGVFALRGRQHADTHMDVRHRARDTVSDIVWRGVADQRSRGVFHGAITVAAGADGSDASLSNKNLLLSAQAEIDTQPVLEIHADEVKAAHGATVGQLDDNALFYMRSRGISSDTARQLLVVAFCSAALSDIEPASLRERVGALLSSRLPYAAES